ncbi:Mut7-C RNAse domain-containing protein [Chloroflexota bacterium]
MKFIVDHNAGKLVKRLRMMGYDTVFFTGEDDWAMVITALHEDRIVLTKDTAIMKMGVAISGKLKTMLIRSDKPEEQIKQVIRAYGLNNESGFFTICMECNRLLEKKTREQVKDKVPPYVLQTQSDFMECPSCNRIFWKGTHWQAMAEEIKKMMRDSENVDIKKNPVNP